MVYTFSDAVTRYGANLAEEDLREAYRRAGVVFKEQLQQNPGGFLGSCMAAGHKSAWEPGIGQKHH